MCDDLSSRKENKFFSETLDLHSRATGLKLPVLDGKGNFSLHLRIVDRGLDAISIRISSPVVLPAVPGLLRN
jgi:hypothetical protein